MMVDIEQQPPLMGKKLLARITCPHCWHVFEPDEILWVAAHSDLRGDPKLDPPGSPPSELQRFLPTRFDLRGNALDSKGQSCQDLACPRCHLVIPWPLLDTTCLFFAILGSPGSGKSFFLGSLAWSMRRTMAQDFCLDFGDADPQFNATLNKYEEALFLQAHPEKHIPVRDLIKKTQFSEEAIFNKVFYGNQEKKYPKPFLLEIKPARTNPNYLQVSKDSRLVCLYDSAGESFQAVSDDPDRLQTTAYMARARALFFLFDPMQDPRFVKALKSKGDAFRGTGGPGFANRQETILRESAARVRRVLGLNQGTLHSRPLIVVVNKWDAWCGLLGHDPKVRPFVRPKDRATACLNMDTISNVSNDMRTLLQKHCPEIVSGAESFCKDVVFLPASPLGITPQPNPANPDPNTGEPIYMIQPEKIDPWWTEVPLTLALSRELPSLIEPVKKAAQKTMN